MKELDITGKELTFEVYKGKSYVPNKPDIKYEHIKVIGLVGLSNENNRQYNYLCGDLVSDLKVNAIFKTGYLIPAKEQSEFQDILKNFPYDETLSTKTTYSEDVNNLIRSIHILKAIAFWISVVFLVFTTAKRNLACFVHWVLEVWTL